MRITQIAWSDKRRNHFVNFYALEPDSNGKVVVLNPPFSWRRNQDAIDQYNSERPDKSVEPYRGRILHVVFDMSSGRLYLPNQESKNDFDANPNLHAMLDAIKGKIEQFIDVIPNMPLIRGDPVDTIRVRRLGDFRSVSDFVRRQVSDYDKFKSDIQIPVVEANLSKMPKTAVDTFGEKPNLKMQWRFIDGNREVEFAIKEGIGESAYERVVHRQKAPFILINTSPIAKVSEADKERIVVLGYKEYAVTNRPDNPTSRDSPLLQSYKYLLYIGWSFRELCMFSLQKNAIPDVATFMRWSAFLYNAAKSLARDGYPDPAANPYYYCFRIGDDFPIHFEKEQGVEVYSQESSHDIFHIVYFDPSISCITIRTPIYMSPELVAKLMKPKSPVVISQYDPTDKVLRTNHSAQRFESAAPATVKAIRKDLGVRTGEPTDDVKVVTRNLVNQIFQKKHISDYPQATEIIKDLCRRISAKPDPQTEKKDTEIRFDDLEVVVGPWQEQYGFLGGYIDKDAMKDKFKGSTTIEPIPGLVITPPVILIDNVESPSVGDRTHIIIHEYRHHINAQLWVKRDDPKNPRDNRREKSRSQGVRDMVAYLQSQDEHVAHKTQFKYMLGIGMSKEQILRHLIGNKPTMIEIPLVKAYLTIINEAAKEVAIEEEEEAMSERAKDLVEGLADVQDDEDEGLYEPPDTV